MLTSTIIVLGSALRPPYREELRTLHTLRPLLRSYPIGTSVLNLHLSGYARAFVLSTLPTIFQTLSVASIAAYALIL